MSKGEVVVMIISIAFFYTPMIVSYIISRKQ